MFLLGHRTELTQSIRWGKVDKVVSAYESSAGSSGRRETIRSREEEECTRVSEYKICVKMWTGDVCESMEY